MARPSDQLSGWSPAAAAAGGQAAVMAGVRGHLWDHTPAERGDLDEGVAATDRLLAWRSEQLVPGHGLAMEAGAVGCLEAGQADSLHRRVQAEGLQVAGEVAGGSQELVPPVSGRAGPLAELAAPGAGTDRSAASPAAKEAAAAAAPAPVLGLRSSQCSRKLPGDRPCRSLPRAAPNWADRSSDMAGRHMLAGPELVPVLDQAAQALGPGVRGPSIPCAPVPELARSQGAAVWRQSGCKKQAGPERGGR